MERRIFVWTAPSLRGPWRLVDTSAVRPSAERGKVWSPEFVDENRPGRTVVAPWQEYWHDARFGKRGQVWAPEVHYFRDTWYIVACMGDHSRKVGSFMLVSEGGIEGPYRLVQGNVEKPFGDPVAGGPAFIEPGAYHHIDGSLYTEGDDAWLVLHNDEYARFRDDMEDIVPTTSLPRFAQTPYAPEPYLEGAYVFRHEGRYYLLHAAWNRSSIAADGSVRYAYDTPAPGRAQYQYDAIVAVADAFEGPYSPRWTAGVGAGHNNLFADHDGTVWATFFRNPAAGYWSDPTRVAQAAVPGVVRMEWTGPEGAASMPSDDGGATDARALRAPLDGDRPSPVPAHRRDGGRRRDARRRRARSRGSGRRRERHGTSPTARRSGRELQREPRSAQRGRAGRGARGVGPRVLHVA
ncbi:family 43 glycosylhydrolase [Microbacterium barkeri]|uniref:family 43 glycosylhydrolase n=1 Tax=Microbacterium barkeri TaxID=33917 RepID=UPI003607B440